MGWFFQALLSVSVVFAGQQPAPMDPAPVLGKYNIDKNAVSISGVSSGGFMAVQMGVAYSKSISAVASVAGGVYWCSQGDTQKAKSVCMGGPENITPQIHIDKAKSLAAGGSIDPVSAMSSQHIYIFASPKDNVIEPLNSDKLKEFYEAFVPSQNIQLQNKIESAHGFVTLSYGNPCQMGFLPWLLKCNFDLAGEILQSAYGALNARTAAVPQHLVKFSQGDFGDEKTPLYKEGWIYVPQACSQGALCRLHVALHGCQMNPDFIQDKFVQGAGFNEWAESNRVIVLYPQSAKIPQDNPYACWDWFGFTGPQYMTQEGSQMQALKKMIDRVQR